MPAGCLTGAIVFAVALLVDSMLAFFE